MTLRSQWDNSRKNNSLFASPSIRRPTSNDIGGHNGHRAKSRDIVAAEYGFSRKNAARYLRLNNLIKLFKDLIDGNKLALLAAVDMSYL